MGESLDEFAVEYVVLDEIVSGLENLLGAQALPHRCVVRRPGLRILNVPPGADKEHCAARL